MRAELAFEEKLRQRGGCAGGVAVKKLAPGVYDDGAGGLHINIAEMLIDAGFPDIPENRELMMRVLVDRMEEMSPETKIMLREPTDPRWKQIR